MKGLKNCLRLLLFVAIVMIAGASCSNASDEIINKNALPQQAQKVLDKYFSAEKVSRVTRDVSSRGRSTYEVDFVSGRDIEFDNKGAWKSIDCKGSKVPDALVPAAIRKYLTHNMSGASVISIDRDARGYDVELSNGLEVVFDVNGNYRYTERDD